MFIEINALKPWSISGNCTELNTWLFVWAERFYAFREHGSMHFVEFFIQLFQYLSYADV